jgi:pyridoxamine 5'-phosphate oxidase
MAKGLQNIGRNYIGSKEIIAMPADPCKLFEQWLAEAIQTEGDDASAMCLSTVSPKGTPSARFVLLKEFDARGLVFFTNYDSRKGKHLQSRPDAALTFYWKNAGRQVRVEGTVEKVSPGESDAYFHSRPYESRINAVISSQSQEIPGREFLENLHARLTKELDGDAPQRPDYWGGYRLLPVYFEFWQGMPNRLHDRIVCCKFDAQWKMKRLAP